MSNQINGVYAFESLDDAQLAGVSGGHFDGWGLVRGAGQQLRRGWEQDKRDARTAWRFIQRVGREFQNGWNNGR